MSRARFTKKVKSIIMSFNLSSSQLARISLAEFVSKLILFSLTLIVNWALWDCEQVLPPVGGICFKLISRCATAITKFPYFLRCYPIFATQQRKISDFHVQHTCVACGFFSSNKQTKMNGTIHTCVRRVRSARHATHAS